MSPTRFSLALLQLPQGNHSCFASFCTQVQTGCPPQLSLVLLLKLQTGNYSHPPMMEQRHRAHSLISSKNKLFPQTTLEATEGEKIKPSFQRVCFAFPLQTWRSEGFMALYKGFFPNWLRLGPWNIIVSLNTFISELACLHTVRTL